MFDGSASPEETPKSEIYHPKPKRKTFRLLIFIVVWSVLLGIGLAHIWVIATNSKAWREESIVSKLDMLTEQGKAKIEREKNEIALHKFQLQKEEADLDRYQKSLLIFTTTSTRQTALELQPDPVIVSKDEIKAEAIQRIMDSSPVKTGKFGTQYDFRKELEACIQITDKGEIKVDSPLIEVTSGTQAVFIPKYPDLDSLIQDVLSSEQD